jgi:hypothetical protein
MTNDKRKGGATAPEKMRTQLNEAQRQALAELELLGWSLKFVRMPMFQDPVPVVISKNSGQIGLLDPDGKIVIDMNHDLRGDNSEPDEANTVAATPATATSGPEATPASRRTYSEKRKGDSPVPEDLEPYLNAAQITALRQIQPFGWELTFVRRPMFLEPVAVITNTDGLRVGTLEADGRIDLQQNFRMREEADTAAKEEKAGPVETKKLVS